MGPALWQSDDMKVKKIKQVKVPAHGSARGESDGMMQGGASARIFADKLFGRMTDALAAAGDEGRGKPR